MRGGTPSLLRRTGDAVQRLAPGLLACAALLASGAAGAGNPAPAVELAPTTELAPAVELAPAGGGGGSFRLDFWPEAGWRLRQEGRRAELEFPRARFALRLAPGTVGAGGPIAALSAAGRAQGTVLRFDLSCDCLLAARGDGQAVLIDVIAAQPAAALGAAAPAEGERVRSAPARAAPPPPPRAARHPVPAPTPAGGPPAQPGAERSAAAAGAADDRPRQGAESGAGRDGRVAAPRHAPLPPPAPAGRRGSPRDVNMIVERTRQRLLDELRQAARAGFITLHGDIAEEAPPPADPGGSEPERAVPAPGGSTRGEPLAPAPLKPSPPPHETLAARVPPSPTTPGSSPASAPDAQPRKPRGHDAAPPMSADSGSRGAAPAGSDAASPPPSARATAGATPVPPLLAAKGSGGCLPGAAFQLPDPLPPERFVAERARLRRELLGEFDRPDEAAALALARLYLAEGLGAEAMALLAEFAPDAAEAPLLASLAWLADGRALPVPNILTAGECTGAQALWQAYAAALAGEPGKAMTLAERAAGALEQTSRLLRGRIAVALGLAALDAGDALAAHRLHAMARRSLAPQDVEGRAALHLLAGRLAQARGEMAEARAELRLAAAAGGEAGAQALLLLAELPPGPGAAERARLEGLRLDLGALALMHRDNPTGRAALVAEALVTGRLEGRAAALDLLAWGERVGVLDPGARARAVAQILPRLEGGRDDTPLALLFERDPPAFRQALTDPAFRRALARSYLALAAPDLAERVLEPGDLSDDGLVAELARAHLARRHAARAAQLAARLPDGPERRLLEGRAAWQMGAAARASAALAAAAAPAAERLRAAWAAGDWPRVLDALAERLTGPGGAAPPASGDATAADPGEGTGAAAARAQAARPPGEEAAEGIPAPLMLRAALAARAVGAGTLPPVLAEALEKHGARSTLEAMLSPVLAMTPAAAGQGAPPRTDAPAGSPGPAAPARPDGARDETAPTGGPSRRQALVAAARAGLGRLEAEMKLYREVLDDG